MIFQHVLLTLWRLEELVRSVSSVPNSPLWENVLMKNHPTLFKDWERGVSDFLNVDGYFRWLEEDPEFHYANLRFVRTFYGSKEGYVRFVPKERRASRFPHLDLLLKEKDKFGIDVFRPRYTFEQIARVLRDYGDDHTQREAALTADQIVINAREERVGSRSPGYFDDKCLCSPQNIVTLLEAGAQVLGLNQEDYSLELKPTGNFSHDVVYRDHRFIAVTQGYWKVLEKFMVKK